MKHSSLRRLGVLTAVAAGLMAPAIRADNIDLKTVVTFRVPVEVPGDIVLPPGTYVIKLLASGSNRHIAEVYNKKMDHLYALAFTAAAFKLDQSSRPGFTFYEQGSGRPVAIRSWFWPSYVWGSEFLYPADQAARIAAASHQKVAIGELPSLRQSGHDNATGPVASSRDSKKRKPRMTPFVASAAELPPPQPEPVAAIDDAPIAPAHVDPDSAIGAPVYNSVAADSRTTSGHSLAHTASYLPLIGTIGLGSLSMAFLMGSIRRRRPY